MGIELANGTTVKTTFGEVWTIANKIGEGGQGYVYLIERDGVRKALKWYKNRAINNKLRNQIRKNVNSGAPSSSFIWPLDTVEMGEKEFGYIMELKPDNYHDMSDIRNNIVDFKSYKRVVDVALGIVNALRVLHNGGCSYQDLNDGNFFVDPIKGKVLICDNDNVVINGHSTGVLGKPRYMAPEIVRREKMPDIYSDYFSLALVIFRLLTKGHPFDGVRTTKGTLTPDLQRLLYGADPIFIFDPEDDRNRPDPTVHKDVMIIWECLPEYMKKIFVRAFGRTGLAEPDKRPSEAEWIDVLVRFRSDIVKCKCGNEAFIKENGDAICDVCGEKLDIPLWIKMPEYKIPCAKDSRIYYCQTCVTDAGTALDPVGRVLASQNVPVKFGMKNMSSSTWKALTKKGIVKEIKPNATELLQEGMIININGSKVVIEGGY